MKKLFSILLAGCMIFMSACSVGVQNSTAPATEGIGVDDATDPIPETSEVILSEEEVFHNFLSKLYKKLNAIVGDDTHLDGFSSQEGMAGVAEIAMLYKKDMLEHMGYKIIDINNDGTPELLVCEIDDLTVENRKGTRILCAYTVSENEMVLLLEGTSRNRFYLLDDMTFYNDNSASNAIVGMVIYRLENESDKLSCVNSYFTSPDENNNILFYQDRTGEWDVSAAEHFAGDEDAFWANLSATASRIQTLDLTMFDAFVG